MGVIWTRNLTSIFAFLKGGSCEQWIRLHSHALRWKKPSLLLQKEVPAEDTSVPITYFIEIVWEYFLGGLESRTTISFGPSSPADDLWIGRIDL
jgi:hypothetical protein